DSAAGKLLIHQLDVADDASVKEFAKAIGPAPIDIVIANAGYFGGERQHKLGDIDFEEMAFTLNTNTLGALRLADALAKNLKAARGRFVAITSRMGSIAEAGSGYLGYRASKAALNMVVHALARDIGEFGGVAVTMSPGWAKTDMGGKGAPQEVDATVREMRKLIGALGPADNGRFLNWKGSEVPW
ncbi:MAG TPA: SDR family oxidoreductase, partial [Parvularculaceae bacterium]|nr:SDR family oxidoreductase [Parvularculaceae bacterium]